MISYITRLATSRLNFLKEGVMQTPDWTDTTQDEVATDFKRRHKVAEWIKYRLFAGLIVLFGGAVFTLPGSPIQMFNSPLGFFAMVTGALIMGFGAFMWGAKPRNEQYKHRS